MIFFLIPIYNEAENLPGLSSTLKGTLNDEEKTYVFVDDGSKDDSVDLLKNLFANERVHILKNEDNRGPGFSFNSGFVFILDELKASNDDAIVTLEGDNTSDINILPTMYMLNRHGYDLVLASPYAQGGTIENATFIRRAASFLANLLLRAWFGIKVLTLSSFYRVYSPELLRAIRAEYTEIIKDNGFISQVEVLVKAVGINTRIIEVPMVLDSKKRKGKSKMKILNTSLSYLKFFVRNRYGKK